MEKKSMAVAMLLSLFCCGGFYAAGIKKGAILFLGVWVFNMVMLQVASPLAIIGTVAGFYFPYKWVNEHNAAVDGGASPEVHA